MGGKPYHFLQTKILSMTTGWKIAIGAGVIGAIYLVATKGKQLISEWAGKINFTIVKFFPLVVRINNPTPIYAPVQSVTLKAYYLKNGMYVPFASAPPTKPFNITPNSSTDVTVHPTLDLKALNPFTGGSVESAINIIANQNPLIDIKVELTINIAGASFVEEAKTKIYLSDLLKNVA